MITSPLHPGQHTYQESKSTETALAETMTVVEKGTINRGLALAVLLDIDGAFNYTTVDSISLGASKNDERLLSSRAIEAQRKHRMLREWVSRGCPQRGYILHYVVPGSGPTVALT